MYAKQSSTTVDFDSVVSRLTSERAMRLAVVAVVLAAVVAPFFGTGAEAQLNVCGQLSNNGLADTISNVLTLLAVLAAISGTVAVALGFAAESAPFLDSGMSSYKKPGLIYGWGFVVILLVLQAASSILGLGVGCFLP